jgi:hypothetical protein
MSDDGDVANAEGNLELKEIQGEQYYHRDPKRALKTFFDNRGLDLDFEYEEEGKGVEKIYRARIRLPIEDLSEFVEPLFGEGDGRRKREAEREACLDGCLKLDRLGVLRGGNNLLAGTVFEVNVSPPPYQCTLCRTKEANASFAGG